MPKRIIFVNRLFKFLGALVKGFAYIFHFFFPKKRFTIPKQSAPLKKSKIETKIPKIIWQTNYSNKAALPVYVNYLVNRWMSPDFEYRFMDHDDRDAFLEENASEEFMKEYNKLTDGAAQADFWRLFVLDHVGGVYMDIDGNSVWPLSKIIEPEDDAIFLMTKHNYSNYFIASAPNNKYLQKTLDIIVDNIKEKRLGGGVYDLTGPTALNLAIGDDEVKHRHNKITCIQGSFTNEYFQYIDKPRGKWTHAKKEELLKG